MFKVSNIHMNHLKQLWTNVCRLFIFYPRNCWITKYICRKHMEFVQSKISLFNKKNMVEKLCRLFINYTVLLNIDFTLLNISIVERLHTLLKPNWLVNLVSIHFLMQYITKILHLLTQTPSLTLMMCIWNKVWYPPWN